MTVEPAPAGAGRLGGRMLLLLLASFLAVALLWRTPVAWPVKIPLVAAHELSQGLGAALSGGSLNYLEVYPVESGLAFTVGGSTWLIYNAGYLGSLLLGVLLLWLGARPWLGRALVLALAALTALAAIRFMPAGASFGLIGAWVAAGALVAAAVFLPANLHAFLGRLLGVASCGYPAIDIASDLLLGSEMRSDARMLGDLTSVPLSVWCGLWLVLSLGAAGVLLWSAWRRGRPAP